VSINIVYQPSDLRFDEFHNVDEQCFPEEPISSESFISLMQSYFWAALSDERLVGYSYLKITPELAWVARVGVVATERNRGIGTKLMDAMLKHCLEIPRHTAMLYVRQDNPAAIHLYKKHGFRISEESYQYIVPIDQALDEQYPKDWKSLDAIPVTEVPQQLRPAFPEQWSHLTKWHDPPKTYVLVFCLEGKRQIGYCRLNPDFPGCFPFELSSPAEQLPGALAGLEPYLSKQHRILKLTFASPEVAQACNALGFKLNYRLYKMTMELQERSS
jgi:ribosomal protein S18 acetylase RimI-like enzyme